MFQKVALSSALLLTVSAVAFGGNFNNVNGGVWSTGVASANPNVVLLGDGSVDTHYVLIANPGSFGTSSFVVMTSTGPLTNPNPLWVSGNGSESKWIGPQADQSNVPQGTLASSSTNAYVYRMFFNLAMAGILANNNTSIQLKWLSDNQGNTTALPPPVPSHIRVCGVASNGSTAACDSNTQIAGSENGGESAAALTTVNITNAAVNGGYTSGWMAMDFYVFNAAITGGQNPTGLRVEILSATGDPVPEPSSVLLFTAGLGLLGFYSRRKL